MADLRFFLSKWHTTFLYSFILLVAFPHFLRVSIHRTIYYLAALGVDFNLFDLLTAMGVVSLSELSCCVEDVGVEGEVVVSSVMVWSPLRAIMWARVFCVATCDRCGFRCGCCFWGGENTNAGTGDEEAATPSHLVQSLMTLKLKIIFCFTPHFHHVV